MARPFIFVIFVSMRTAAILLLIVFAGLASCKKYEDGPGLSLRTKKARLSNQWSVKEYYEDHEDKTSDYRSIIEQEMLEIRKDGTYSYNETSNWPWGIPADEGKWEWKDDKESVTLTSTPHDNRIEYRILRLKEMELWVETTDSTGKLLEYHFVTKEML